jgi:hypothetical protein
MVILQNLFSGDDASLDLVKGKNGNTFSVFTTHVKMKLIVPVLDERGDIIALKMADEIRPGKKTRELRLAGGKVFSTFSEQQDFLSDFSDKTSREVNLGERVLMGADSEAQEELGILLTDRRLYYKYQPSTRNKAITFYVEAFSWEAAAQVLEMDEDILVKDVPISDVMRLLLDPAQNPVDMWVLMRWLDKKRLMRCQPRSRTR